MCKIHAWLQAGVDSAAPRPGELVSGGRPTTHDQYEKYVAISNNDVESVNFAAERSRWISTSPEKTFQLSTMPASRLRSVNGENGAWLLDVFIVDCARLPDSAGWQTSCATNSLALSLSLLKHHGGWAEKGSRFLKENQFNQN